MSPLRGLGIGIVGCDPQDLRHGLAFAPIGLWDRGCGLSWSALRWVVFACWFARGEILRVAQNDKGTGGNDNGDRGGQLGDGGQ